MEIVIADTCCACCSDVRLPLKEHEAARLNTAGTELIPVLRILGPDDIETAEPGAKSEQLPSWSDRDRMMAFGRQIRETVDQKEKEALLQIAKFAGQMGPGEGLFDMKGRCGNLQSDGLCADYDNRPFICQGFEVGGSDCRDMKMIESVSVPITLTRKPVD